MKNIVLSIILLTVFASGLLTNTDKKEKYKDKTILDNYYNYYNKDIEKTIKRGRKLTLKQIQQLYYHVVKDNDGDIRELNLLIKFIKNGNEDAQKIAIEILPKSIKDNFDTIRDRDYKYFYKLLQPTVNSRYDALVVESCVSLYKISVMYKQTFDDSLLSILEYYARGTNSENWNLEHTIRFRDYNPQSPWLKRYCEEKGFNVDEYTKQRAILEIRRIAIEGFFLVDNIKNNEILIEIMNNDKGLHSVEEPFYLKNMIKRFFKRKERGKFYDLNYKLYKNDQRDPNWNGELSASYCRQYYDYDDYNEAYHAYDNDCANFGSQCLIAGGLDLHDYNGSQYLDDRGCIPSAPNLHTYLSSRPDVKSKTISFWSHQSWNPDEHIPDWFIL